MADDSKTWMDTGDQGGVALRHFLKPLERFFKDPAVSEVCVNRPGEIWTEGRRGWERHAVEVLTFDYLQSLAQLVATSVRQRVNEAENSLSASLDSGERIELVLPPSVPKGTVSITIRTSPPLVNKTLPEYASEGFFETTKSSTLPLTAIELELIRLRGELSEEEFSAEANRLGKYWLTKATPEEVTLMVLRDQRRWTDFFRLAVTSHQNIIISGATQSGKTTFCRTLINDIECESRIITIEDTPELALPDHPNHVHLFYSKGSQGVSISTPQSLLASCMRMRPDRILLSELRGQETNEYVKSLNSGHPGSITTVHANSPDEAYYRLVDLMREGSITGAQSDDVLLNKLYRAVHIVCQILRDKKTGRRYMSSVYFDPRCRIAGVSPQHYKFGD